MLFPYIYTSAVQSSRESIPLLRPMYLDYPNVEAAYHNSQEYMFGDNLLVAPVTQAGVGPGRVAKQVVWFPTGGWYDWFSGTRYDRGTALVADDIDEFPLFVRGGTVIPMQPFTTRMASTPHKTVVLRCYPGTAAHASELYEDDGETTAYRGGAAATTPLKYVPKDGAAAVEIGPARGSFAGQVSTRAYVVEFAGLGRATRASVDGKPAKVEYAPSMGINRGLVPATSS